MNVSELCPQDILACPQSMTLAGAGRMLRQGGIDSLPVLDRRSHVLGMISTFDIHCALARFGSSAENLTVESAMDREFALCHPTEDVRDVLPLLGLLRVSRLPIVSQEDQLIGIFSIEELLCRVLETTPGDALLASAVLDAFFRLTQPVPDRHWTSIPTRRSLPLSGRAPKTLIGRSA